MGSKSLSDFDPLSLVNGLINCIPVLKSHQTYLYTIIVELYTNALEHGILAMDCATKEATDGFARYYAERERLLLELDEGWLRVRLQCFGDDSSGELIMQIEDSGKGFDASAMSNDIHMDANTRTSGRGMGLVRSLCKSLTYDQCGNHVRAVYAW